MDIDIKENDFFNMFSGDMENDQIDTFKNDKDENIFFEFAHAFHEGQFELMLSLIPKFRSWISFTPPGYETNGISNIINICLTNNEISIELKKNILIFIYNVFGQKKNNHMSSSLINAGIISTLEKILFLFPEDLNFLIFGCFANIAGGNIDETKFVRTVLSPSKIAQNIMVSNNQKSIFYMARILHNFSRVRTNEKQAIDLFECCSRCLPIMIQKCHEGISYIIWALCNLKSVLQSSWPFHCEKNEILNIIQSLFFSGNETFLIDDEALFASIMFFNLTFFNLTKKLLISIEDIFHYMEIIQLRQVLIYNLSNLLGIPFANELRIIFLRQDYLQFFLSIYEDQQFKVKEEIIQLICTIFKFDSFSASLFAENNIIDIFSDYLETSTNSQLIIQIINTINKIFTKCSNVNVIRELYKQVLENGLHLIFEELQMNDDNEVANTASCFDFFDEEKMQQFT